jgi:hypothetical protein
MDAIISANFLNEYQVDIYFLNNAYTTKHNGKSNRHSFLCGGTAGRAPEARSPSSPSSILNDFNRSEPIGNERPETDARVDCTIAENLEFLDRQVDTCVNDNDMHS